MMELDQLLASMEPLVVPGEFVYVTVPSGSPAVPAADVLAMVTETEGTTYVLRRAVADALGHDYDFVAGWITLQVHSSLSAVGLTAAVSAALTEIGISCNVLAGFHHDHLLVPIAFVSEAMTTLTTLTRR